MKSKTLEHIGEVRLMHCGQTAQVIGWYQGKPIIKFEDGTTVENRRYEDFKTGSVMNPKLMDLTGTRFGSFIVIGPTGKSDKHRYKTWYCRCICGNVVEISRPEILGQRWQRKNCGQPGRGHSVKT